MIETKMPYAARRAALHRALEESGHDGTLLLLGAELYPRNYPDNPQMPFRQDSHFLYYTGIDVPGYALLSMPDGQDVLFGPEQDLSSIVWEGLQRTAGSYAEAAGIPLVQPQKALFQVASAREDLLYLPPYRADRMAVLQRILRRKPHEITYDASKPLVEAIVAQRLRKSEVEIAAIEGALSLTQTLFHEAMAMTRAGVRAADIYGMCAGRIASKYPTQQFSFPPIITTHGEVLHNHHYDDTLADGRLVLMDMGAEAANGYASDITRAWPVSGTFTSQQRDLYEVVLSAQQVGIDAIAPGAHFREIHLQVARQIVVGLQAVGLMQGDPDEAVAAGAHALFFPHGLGHMMGIDVHDMEDLGDVVGYGLEGQRSDQFGLNFLRLSRPLEAGHVVTVEPGVYLIPALIQEWEAARRHSSFVCYEALAPYMSFGGIRIEDDVLVTAKGGRVLGPPIAKQVADVEARVQGITRS